jgi:hypothetical protein
MVTEKKGPIIFLLVKNIDFDCSIVKFKGFSPHFWGCGTENKYF